MTDTKPYWSNDTSYFLTGTTFLHYPYFNDFPHKQLVLNQILKIRRFLPKNNNDLIYSIAINHYHIKFYLENGLLLSKIKQMIHGGCSFLYRKKYPMKYQELWQDHKIVKITSDTMDWKITGYIIGNLLKHKEVNNFEELKENPFSSYQEVSNKFGDEFTRNMIYRVIDVEEQSDGYINLGKLGNIEIKYPSTGL
jgi:hypothetical protein